MRFPNQNRWIQTNNGKLLGSLGSTRNINFEQEGEAALSKKGNAIVTGATSNFGEAVAYGFLNSKYHILTDEQMFEGTLDGTAFTATSSSPTFTLDSDLIAFGSKLVASDDTALHEWNGSAWTQNKVTGLTASRPHPLCLFDSLPTYKLAVGDDNTVKVYDTSYNLYGNTLTLPTAYRVTSLAYRNGYLYIGTLYEGGGEARIFAWNGDGTNAQYSIPTGAGWIFSMCPYKETIACVTDEGEVLGVSGSGVVRLAAFPVFYNQGSRWRLGNTFTSPGKVFMNGMAAQGDTIYINIEGKVDSKDMPDMQSGLWRLDPDIGLHHYASATTDLVVKDTGFTVATNTITTSANHNLVTGDAVMFDNTDGITGVSDQVLYYAINTGANTIQLGASRHQANEGNAMTISGTVTTDELWYFPNTDYGNSVYARSGAVFPIPYFYSVFPLFDSDVIFGSETKNTSGTATETVCVTSPSFNHGRFETQRIYSGQISEAWQDIYTFLSGALSSNEKVVVKYQFEDRLSLPTPHISITWSDGDTFTTTDERLTDNAKVGDEVVIVEGYGQGRTTHITSVSVAGGTTTINVDESWGNATSTATVYVTSYKKAGSFTSTRELNQFGRTSIATVKSPWIRIKVELRGFEPTVSGLEIVNKPDNYAV